MTVVSGLVGRLRGRDAATGWALALAATCATSLVTPFGKMALTLVRWRAWTRL